MVTKNSKASSGTPRPNLSQRDSEVTRKTLINAVGATLGKSGFLGLGVNAVAREAGVDKVLIYRYFGGLNGLITAFAVEGDFWPDSYELTGGDPEGFAASPLAERLKRLGRNYLRALRSRPLTRLIMSWEMVQRNELTQELETLRERRMMEFARKFFADSPKNLDLMAILAIIGGGLGYLACREGQIDVYNDVDIGSESGWERIEAALSRIVDGLI